MNNNISGLCGRFPVRYVLVILGYFGLMNVYLLRVNLNVAIVAMVKSDGNTDDNYNECPRNSFDNQSTEIKEGPFDWSPTDQGIILGCFFWGYVIVSFFSGYLAEHLGAKLIFGVSVLVTSVLTLLTQVAANYSKWALVALRVLEGIFEGMSWPSMHTISGRWLPKSERAFLYSIIHTGAETGTVIGYPISAALCDSTFLGGWPAAFYIFGCMGIVWFCFWWMLIYDLPSQHPRISEEEREYIFNGIEDRKDTERAPWLKILTSIPLWSVAFTSFFTHWAFEFIFTDLSSFLDKVLHYNIKANGILSSLPHICHVLVQWSGGYLADFIYSKNYFTRTSIRKAMNLFSCLLTGFCFIGAIFSGCDKAKVVTLIIIGTGAQGLNVPSFNVALLDMAPRFAGTLMGIANGLGNIGSFAAPMVAGVLTEEKTLQSWNTAFYIAAGFSFLGGLTFTLFGSSELQPWAKVEEIPNDQETVQSNTLELRSMRGNNEETQ